MRPAAIASVGLRACAMRFGKLRLIYGDKRKNDTVDALKLAKLLYAGFAPQVHVPSQDVRGWRRTIEFRSRLVRKRTRAKVGLRALLHGCGVKAKRGLWSRSHRVTVGLQIPQPSEVAVVVQTAVTGNRGTGRSRGGRAGGCDEQ